MKLSNLQKRLTILQQRHGDIEVCVNDWAGEGDHFNKVVKPEIVKAKPHCGGYFRTLALEDGGYGGRKAFTEPTQSGLEKKRDVTLIVLHDGTKQ